ncbi:hypothetical protein B0J17DRAFT_635233 [Rhizoctonia solani]|nr:hypothetical protein B0J17DRAFT_635233 [Rhizoctonia solani]
MSIFRYPVIAHTTMDRTRRSRVVTLVYARESNLILIALIYAAYGLGNRKYPTVRGALPSPQTNVPDAPLGTSMPDLSSFSDVLDIILDATLSPPSLMRRVLERLESPQPRVLACIHQLDIDFHFPEPSNTQDWVGELEIASYNIHNKFTTLHILDQNFLIITPGDVLIVAASQRLGHYGGRGTPGGRSPTGVGVSEASPPREAVAKGSGGRLRVVTSKYEEGEVGGVKPKGVCAESRQARHATELRRVRNTIVVAARGTRTTEAGHVSRARR